MALKKNNPGCLCCGPACQEAWNDLLAKFTSYEITGTTLTTKSGNLVTGGFTTSCGDSATALECDSDGYVFVTTGASCTFPFYFEGVWRANMGTTGCAAGYKYVSYATFSLYAELVSGVKRWKAEYLVATLARASGAKVCQCNTADYYLDDPYAGGLIYQNGSTVALYDATDITLNFGDDISYSYVSEMFNDAHPTNVFDCTIPYSLAADDTPATGYYDHVREYKYGKYRGIYTDDLNDIPTSVSLTPLVNPCNIDATFTFT